jgi:hypothetical protein
MLIFPYSILRMKSFRLDLVGQVISGGITAAGQQQRVNATGGGLWALQADFPRFNTADQLRAWRVVQYGSQGGVEPVNIAICDLRQAPRPPGWIPTGAGVPHSDLTPFSDGGLYGTDSISSTLAADAAVRATTIRVTFDGDSVPLGGQFFSLSYGAEMNELHVTTGATLVSGDTYDLTFLPPLRAAHEAGETVTWDHPTGTFVLAQADSMSMATDYGRFGEASAAFVEYIG